MVSRFSLFQKKISSSVIRKVVHSLGQQLGSFSNPQESDFEKFKYLLKYVNQTRDLIFIMDPQVPAPNSQGLIPVEIVSYSDSD